MRIFKRFTGRYYICNLNKIKNELDKAVILDDLSEDKKYVEVDKTAEEEDLSEN